MARAAKGAMRNRLPGPFSLAVALTLFVLGTALLLFKPGQVPPLAHGKVVLQWWYQGMWSAPQLNFAFQMLLILVLGHTLALSAPAKKLMQRTVAMVQTNAQAAAFTCGLAVVLGFFNWGLTLIIGAVFARFLAEEAQQRGLAINYPLIAASGYTGMMVWHGGLSGSALLKSAEPGHLQSFLAVIAQEHAPALPEQLPLTATVFSAMNLFAALSLLVALPALAYVLGMKSKALEVPMLNEAIDASAYTPVKETALPPVWRRPAFGLGLLVLGTACMLLLGEDVESGRLAAGPNYVNMWLLGLALLAHGSITCFSAAVKEGMAGAAGILIQFPLYFGIMGVLQHSGIGAWIADFFVGFSTAQRFPFAAFLSAGVLNMLIPSGGGQWMIQAPILLEASGQLGTPLPKAILAFAYGDQLTNMLQPFWALPLLGITGLKAGQVLPYTLKFMLAGAIIFTLALWLF